MSSPIEYRGIHLKQNFSLANQGYQLAGMMALLCCLIAPRALSEGKAAGLFFPAITCFCLAFAKFMEWLGEKHFAILYSDRYEVPGLGSSNTIVYWSQVTSLRWRGTSRSSAWLKVKVPQPKSPLGSVLMDLSHLNAEELLIFIRYVRLSARHIPQERWPAFCRQVAVPILKAAESKANLPADPPPRTIPERIRLGVTLFLASHPFWAGMLLPVSFLLLIPSLISRRTCWFMAALLAVTAFINIRLVWGDWLQPFTSRVLGTAVAFLILSIFAGVQRPHYAMSKSFANNIGVVSYAAVGVIVLPLLVNSLFKGWIPSNWATPLFWLAFGLFYIPLFLLAFRSYREGKNQRRVDELEQEAMYYWDAKEALIGGG